jgi:hypothetical protein
MLLQKWGEIVRVDFGKLSRALGAIGERVGSSDRAHEREYENNGGTDSQERGKNT